MMKKWLCMTTVALLCMLCVTGVCVELERAFLSARPDCVIASLAQNGNTAASVLTDGNGKNILCIAQRRDGQWQVTVQNAKALDGVPQLALEREDRISWTYEFREEGIRITYSAEYAAGEWGAVQAERVYADKNFMSVNRAVWADGVIRTRVWSEYCADGMRNEREIMSVPAKWMQERVKLQNFDPGENLYSNGMDYDWLSREVVAHAAAELMPQYAFVDGHAEYDGMLFLMERTDGARVVVGCTYDDQKGFVICESAPLPDDMRSTIGYENFTGALVLSPSQGRSIPLQLAPYGDGVWGLRCHVDFIGQVLGRNFMQHEDGRYLFGTHPWGNIRTMDWKNLPWTQEQMRAGFDTHGWATPASANPADRLHLRAAPRRDAVSLGKYYNGTPLRVLERMGDWTQVDVLGVEGYMMTKFLAFGDDAGNVVQRVDSYLLTGSTAALYERTGDEQPACLLRESPKVVGVLGDVWYHVWDPQSGLSGFIRQNELWPGNG